MAEEVAAVVVVAAAVAVAAEAVGAANRCATYAMKYRPPVRGRFFCGCSLMSPWDAVRDGPRRVARARFPVPFRILPMRDEVYSYPRIPGRRLPAWSVFRAQDDGRP